MLTKHSSLVIITIADRLSQSISTYCVTIFIRRSRTHGGLFRILQQMRSESYEKHMEQIQMAIAYFNKHTSICAKCTFLQNRCC